MLASLRLIAILNAALWFGAGVFFTFAVGPAFFSPPMRELLGPAGFQYYAGGVAMIVLQRYFILQYVCGTLALLLLGAEAMHLGRRPARRPTALVAALLLLGLAGGLLLQPHMAELRHTMYTAAAPADREQAKHKFGLWHGLSQAGNLLVLAGLLTHLVRVSRPPEPSRFGDLRKLRG